MKTTLLKIQEDYHYSGNFGLLISHDKGPIGDNPLAL